MWKDKPGGHMLLTRTKDPAFDFDDAIRSLQDVDEKIGEFIKETRRFEKDQGNALGPGEEKT
jgi:hypothetical protein